MFAQYVLLCICILGLIQCKAQKSSEILEFKPDFIEKLEYGKGKTSLPSNVKSLESNYVNDNINNYDTPEDCQIEKVKKSDGSEVTLTCSVRTVNSDFDTTNFSVIPASNTVSLNIICNNDIMAESSLRPHSFSHLGKLQQLSILNCKINKLNEQTLQGLDDLQNLTITTNNILWPSLNFNIDPKALDNLKNLVRLDFSSNNMWSLPENLFCPLCNLIYLNLSHNQIQDINDLGFRDNSNSNITNTQINSRNYFLNTLNDNNKTQNKIKSKLDINNNATGTFSNNCFLDLHILDVSYNQFVFMPSYGFGNLRNLKILKLSNNEISMIADKALMNLQTLEILNLESNKIVALPGEFFLNVGKSLKEVYLSNNSISVLSPKIFAYLDHLQTLDLSFNKITSAWIDDDTFSGLIRLVMLDLSYNQITHLERKIFTDLYTLQILKLQHNKIEVIHPNTFSPMTNLHTLILSYNNLVFLDVGPLNGLFVLSLLSLDNNLLTGVHDNALNNCSSLQELYLNANQLTSVPATVKSLSLLLTIDLGENHISTLEKNNFNGLLNLYGLRLIGNLLENVTRDTFKELQTLQILNLSKNLIKNIEFGAFEVIKNIQAIRLDGNKIKTIKRLFHDIKTLLWLNISDNEIEIFDYSSIPVSLQWLDIHKNNISELSNTFHLTNLTLQTLDASFNRITKISPASIPNSIELLFLNDNLIANIEPDTFIHKVNLTRVDLYSNKILTLDIKSLRIVSLKKPNTSPEFYIGSNPFNCDCNIDWLQKVNNIDNWQYPIIADLDNIYCKLLNSRVDKYVPLREAQPKNFLCYYETHCFTVCHCCEFDACDCKMTCPLNCTCYHDQAWTTNIVDCSNTNYSHIPKKIPIDASELYIDGNNFVELYSHTFLGRKNLVILYVNNSNVRFIYNTTFAGLKRLAELHLENNQISILQGPEFYDLENLRNLYLQNNHIEFVANATFQHLQNLKILKLNGNRIFYFEVWHLLANPQLTQLTLSNNPWTCECSFLLHFKTFLAGNIQKIPDGDNVFCFFDNMTSILKNDHVSQCNILQDINLFFYGRDIKSLLPTFMIGIICFIGCFILISGVFFYRNELRLWADKNWVPRVCYRAQTFIDEYDDPNSSNDAYLAYSLQDKLFVDQVFSRTLEDEFGYRLCLHYRDNIISSPFWSESLIECAEKSKQFVIILSKHFLYNEWIICDYKKVLSEIMKRKIPLVFILYGELPQRDIDADMRKYLKISTCIEWDDKRFWHKLRLALPIRFPKKTRAFMKPITSSNYYNNSNSFKHSTTTSTTTKQKTNQVIIGDCDDYCRTNTDAEQNYATFPNTTSACRLKNFKDISNRNSENNQMKFHNTYTLDKNFKHENCACLFLKANCYHASQFGYEHLKNGNKSETITTICTCRDFGEKKKTVSKDCRYLITETTPAQSIYLERQKRNCEN